MTRRACSLLALALLLGACSEPLNTRGPSHLVPDCESDGDGLIDASELPVSPGIEARWWASGPSFPWAEQGLDPTRSSWDFSTGPEDVASIQRIESAAVAGWSTAGAFAVPAFVDIRDLYVIQDVTDGDSSAVEALGWATRSGIDESRRFDVRYDPPVPVLELPLSVGQQWSAETAFRGAFLAGLPNQGVERWSFEVLGTGTASLPGGIEVEEVLVLSTEVQQRLAIGTTPARTLQRWSFLAPCFGEVAFLTEGDAPGIGQLGRLAP